MDSEAIRPRERILAHAANPGSPIRDRVVAALILAAILLWPFFVVGGCYILFYREVVRQAEREDAPAAGHSDAGTVAVARASDR